MANRLRAIAGVLVLLGAFAPSAEVWAQNVVQSFSELQPHLSPQREVMVRDAEGHTTKGWVISLNGGQLVVERRGRSARPRKR